MAERPPPHDRDVPDGYELVAVADLKWRAASGRRCRFGAGYHKPACGKPAVAVYNRSSTNRPRWWAYCRAHLYGRWIEGDQIMQWVLREKAAGDG
jgi:hypothetical protein